MSNKARQEKERSLSPNVAGNDVFEIALQKKNYSIAECILRDLSLKNAVKKENSSTLMDPSCFKNGRRRNSFHLSQDINSLEVDDQDCNSSCSL